jgi:phage terminase large subunit-like protein
MISKAWLTGLRLVVLILTICSKKLGSLKQGFQALAFKIIYYIEKSSPKKIKEKQTVNYDYYIGQPVAQFYSKGMNRSIRPFNAKIVGVNSPGKMVVQYDITAKGKENVREVFDLTEITIATVENTR